MTSEKNLKTIQLQEYIFFVSDDIASDRLKIIISDKKIMDAIRPPSRIDRLLE